MKPRAIPEASIDTRLLFERLKKLGPGEIVPYPELAEIIGRDVQRGKGYSSALSARNMLLNESPRIVIEAVAKEGLKRLTDHECAMIGPSVINGIRRKVRKGAKKLAAVQNFDGLTREEKVAHNTGLSMLGAIQQAVSAKAVGRIEKEVERAVQAIPVSKTLALFGG
jgi:hypothetical protein